MSIASFRRPVKPSRVSAHPALPFGHGILVAAARIDQRDAYWEMLGRTVLAATKPEYRQSSAAEALGEPTLSCPIDQRPLPTIDGVGLTSEEIRRVTGAQNRARASYGYDCPEATFAEVEAVARRAATDELRRCLKDRPAAPTLAVQVGPIGPTSSTPAKAKTRPRLVIDPVLEAVNRENTLAALGLLPARGLMRHSFEEFDAWLEHGHPEPEPELTAAGTWA